MGVPEQVGRRVRLGHLPLRPLGRPPRARLGVDPRRGVGPVVGRVAARRRLRRLRADGSRGLHVPGEPLGLRRGAPLRRSGRRVERAPGPGAHPRGLRRGAPHRGPRRRPLVGRPLAPERIRAAGGNRPRRSRRRPRTARRSGRRARLPWRAPRRATAPSPAPAARPTPPSAAAPRPAPRPPCPPARPRRRAPAARSPGASARGGPRCRRRRTHVEPAHAGRGADPRRAGARVARRGARPAPAGPRPPRRTRRRRRPPRTPPRRRRLPARSPSRSLRPRPAQESSLPAASVRSARERSARGPAHAPRAAHPSRRSPIVERARARGVSPRVRSGRPSRLRPARRADA